MYFAVTSEVIGSGSAIITKMGTCTVFHSCGYARGVSDAQNDLFRMYSPDNYNDTYNHYRMIIHLKFIYTLETYLDVPILVNP